MRATKFSVQVEMEISFEKNEDDEEQKKQQLKILSEIVNAMYGRANQLWVCVYLSIYKDKSTWIIELKYEFISQNWTQFFVQI